MSSQRGRLTAVGQLLTFGLVWSVAGFFRLLPTRWAFRAGAFIGGLYARVRGPRYDVALQNLAIAFPEYTDAARREIARASFQNLGRTIAEFALLQGSRRGRLLAEVEVEGVEHLEAARARTENGGVLVLTAHFGDWELLGAAMAHRGQSVCAIHHGFENPHFDAWLAKWRRHARMETLELGRAGLSVLRALGQGHAMAVLLDQNAGRDEGIFAPFFSRLASTRSGPALLAATRDVPVVPAFCFRRDGGQGNVVKFAPELKLVAPGEDPEATLLDNVTRMNRVIESAIRSAPDQWNWVHKRWKTRPQGEEPIYASRRA